MSDIMCDPSLRQKSLNDIRIADSESQLRQKAKEPLAKQQVEDKYWLEFMRSYSQGLTYGYQTQPRSPQGGLDWRSRDGYKEYPLVDQFWMWLVKVKVPQLNNIETNGWEQL